MLWVLDTEGSLKMKILPHTEGYKIEKNEVNKSLKASF